jgi:hypothetical protein
MKIIPFSDKILHGRKVKRNAYFVYLKTLHMWYYFLWKGMEDIVG